MCEHFFYSVIRLQQMPMSHYQVIPIARTCPSPPPRPLGKPFLETTDSACGGATPGPVESEDRRIADGSSASSLFRLMHRASSCSMQIQIPKKN
ncbi:hypothetical protein BGW80DRAFT_1401714 [Lactifluus volemus]|nr:hypothetical protein BGW80DRAFT_1401714 [Lactifluus volemus]